jgi:hypothetical protein
MRAYHIIAILAVILVGIGAQIFFTSPSSESPGMIGASAQAPAGNFSPDCARKETAAITLIDDHGAAGDLSSDRLGQAGLTMMRARAACYQGRFGEALALYDSIIHIAPVASLSGQRR